MNINIAEQRAGMNEIVAGAVVGENGATRLSQELIRDGVEKLFVHGLFTRATDLVALLDTSEINQLGLPVAHGEDAIDYVQAVLQEALNVTNSYDI